MKKSFILEGLDCANCAAKIEDKLNGVKGVSEATVNFMTSKVTIVGEDEEFDEIMKRAIDIIKKYEPDAQIKY